MLARRRLRRSSGEELMECSIGEESTYVRGDRRLRASVNRRIDSEDDRAEFADDQCRLCDQCGRI